MIGQKKTKILWHQSEARTTPTVWNWSGKTLSPGALILVLDFSTREFFSRLFRLFPAPTNCPWVSEDEAQHSASQFKKDGLLLYMRSRFCRGKCKGLFTWREGAPANRTTRLEGLTHSPPLHATHPTETVSEMCGLSFERPRSTTNKMADRRYV